jgi:nucleoside-diphosphate-sugar epimerase
MKILITGSRGFVGKEVVATLKKKHKMIEYDSSIGKNILDRAELYESLKGVDTIVHLAAIVENDNPALWEVNVKGTKNLVEEAVKRKVKKIIYLSSTGVYGIPKGKVNEKSETAPENNYEKSKLEAEKVLLAQQEKICVNIIRSAMVFGSNNYWKKMFDMLYKNYPLPLKGENTFQLAYVKELSRFIEILLKKGKCGETYLFASKEKMTLNDFCKKSKEIMGKKGKIMHVPQWIGESVGKILHSKTLTKENIRHLGKERHYDLRKMGHTGYKEKIEMEQAIKETLKELKLI